MGYERTRIITICCTSKQLVVGVVNDHFYCHENWRFRYTETFLTAGLRSFHLSTFIPQQKIYDSPSPRIHRRRKGLLMKKKNKLKNEFNEFKRKRTECKIKIYSKQHDRVIRGGDGCLASN